MRRRFFVLVTPLGALFKSVRETPNTSLERDRERKSGNTPAHRAARSSQPLAHMEARAISPVNVSLLFAVALGTCALVYLGVLMKSLLYSPISLIHQTHNWYGLSIREHYVWGYIL
jgi:hypothetical protein